MWKQMSLALLVVGLTAVTALAQDATPVPAQPSTSPSSTSSVVGGDDADLRAFIIRFMSSSLGGEPVQITLGALPSDLPFTLTTPADAIVYSTMAHPSQNGPANYDIMYDTNETPQAVINFYKQAYDTSDWIVASENIPPASAFTGDLNGYASFCYQKGAATLNINSYDTINSPNAVSINVQVPGDPYTCSATQAPVTDPIYALIPSLALPDGVTVTSNMGGGFSYYTLSGRSNSVSAILQSARPLADIATDYNAQLATDGWIQVSTENSERTAFSTWSLSDSSGKTWHGALLIVADKTPNLYDAVIYIEE